MGQTVELDIIICGWEELSLVTDGPREYFFFLDDVPLNYTRPLGEVNITSNDTYCPVMEYVLTADSPDNYTEAEEPESFDNYNITDDGDLLLFPDTTGNYTFYVLATTTSGMHIYKQVDMEVAPACPNENDTFSLANSNTLTIRRDKNIGNTEELLSNEDIQALFELKTPEQCRIREIEIFKESDDELIVDGDEGFDLLNLDERDSTGEMNLTARTSVSRTDGTVLDVPFTFRLKATANGGGSIFKTVTYRIVVCGSERIIAVDDDKT
jgi:hypothetical protein